MRYKFRSFLIITAILLFMVVGYAAVSVTFKFEGVAQVGSNEDDFRVSFTRAILDGEDVATTAISGDGIRLKYKSGALKLAGEKSVMEFAITNNSKQYDAKMQLVCDDLSDENATLDIDLDSKRADAGENVLGTITVTLNKDYPQPEEGEEEVTLDLDVSCRLKLTALERTVTGEDAPEIEDKEYKETLLNGADPVLAEGMIPVRIDDDGKVTYANTNRKWYKYADQEWANVVILKDGITTMYNVGNVIKEEDIEAYFVWIPRYKYKLWNVDAATGYVENNEDGTPNITSAIQTIDIVFETKDVEPSNGTKNGEYLTHPAFTNFDVNGLWVAKFETGHGTATTKAESNVSVDDASLIVIKPNTLAWRGNRIVNAFKSSYNYKREMDSHLMKNTEWGAVAYLTNSRFGINKKVRINNHQDFRTGYAYVNEPSSATNGGGYSFGTAEKVTQPYNSEIGVLASTTGNITGIYDMSGGNAEYVAATLNGTVGRSGLTADELNEFAKYIDFYDETSTISSYNNRILGDATGEMGPFYFYADEDKYERGHNSWYTDYSDFIYETKAWFTRGGRLHNGKVAGQFAFYGESGEAINNIGSRITLAVK
ncbi:MAG: hypothetical protein K2I70_01365 [Bacilli bacterium]|nr:hypothetical protein [Bacilli bacterium]